jgi:hypothetical protein
MIKTLVQFSITGTMGLAAASLSVESLAQEIVITPNCAACFGVAGLAIKTVGGGMRNIVPGDLAALIPSIPGFKSTQEIGRVHAPTRVATVGSIAKNQPHLGEGPTGIDARFVQASDAEFLMTYYWVNQWAVDAKGLRARSGGLLKDAFVRHGFCEGDMVRVPTWQIHGADGRPLVTPQPGGVNTVTDTVETGAAEIRETLSLYPDKHAVTICMARLTSPKDFYSRLVGDQLRGDLRKMENAYAPAFVQMNVQSALAEVLASNKGKLLIQEAVNSVILTPSGLKAIPEPAASAQ